MAVSKRLRFEVLRRDNHACRYCGASAPDVVLHVDHVIPEALGGTTVPENLATACSDCNGGKSSSAPDQSVVADVKNATAQWKSAIEQAADEARRDASGRADLYAAVVNAWPNFYRREIPKDFTETIDQFANAGLPDEVIVEMAQLAGAKPNIFKRWPYFCGCCWTKVRQLQERALELVGNSEVEPEDTTADLADIAIHLGIKRIMELQPGSERGHLHAKECFHGIKWRVPEVHAAVRTGREYPCSDLACIAAYGEVLTQQVHRCVRDEAVMDAADELTEAMH